MSNIFDLEKVKQLIEKERPVCAVLLDTNVIMNFPLYDNWKVTSGPTVFILPSGTNNELEYLKNKNIKNDPDSQKTPQKAIEAIKHINNLFSKGTPPEGIPIPGGWAISVPLLKRDELQLELNQIDDITQAFGRFDAQYLLLSKECSQQLTTPTVMVTGDKNLCNVAQANGIPLRLFKEFPLETPIEVKKSIYDWDEALREMNLSTEKDSIEIKVTLHSKIYQPTWPESSKSLVIAKGQGLVLDGAIKRPFIWTVPYVEKIFMDSFDDSPERADFNTEIYIDFMIGDVPKEEQRLYISIAEGLSKCTSPSFEAGLISLQSTDSILYDLLISEYKREGIPSASLKIKVEKSEGSDLAEEWDAWIQNKPVYERSEIFDRYRNAVSHSWPLGKSHSFRIMKDEKKR